MAAAGSRRCRGGAASCLRASVGCGCCAATGSRNRRADGGLDRLDGNRCCGSRGCWARLLWSRAVAMSAEVLHLAGKVPHPTRAEVRNDVLRWRGRRSRLRRFDGLGRRQQRPELRVPGPWRTASVSECLDVMRGRGRCVWRRWAAESRVRLSGRALPWAASESGYPWQREECWFGWSGWCRTSCGRSGLRPLLDTNSQRFGLCGFQSIELAGDSRETEFFAKVNEHLAVDVQLLSEREHSNFFVLLGLFFRLRDRQAELLWGCPQQPPNLPTGRAAGVLDRPTAPRMSYILIPRPLMKRGPLRESERAIPSLQGFSPWLDSRPSHSSAFSRFGGGRVG